MFLDFFKNQQVKEYSLGEVCEIIAGIRFSPSQYKKSGMLVLKTQDIQDGEVICSSFLYCDPNNHPSDEKYKVIPGDVLVVGQGMAGKVGINTTNNVFYLDKNVFKICPNEGVLTKKYLYHFLLSCPEEIQKFVKGMIPGLTKANLASLKIPIPSLEVQRYIVEKLDKFREIEREIEREISLRQKQYEYYREYLIGGE